MGCLKLVASPRPSIANSLAAKPEGYEKLSEQQRKEFDFARAVGISEADSFTLAKMSGSTFKEVSRR